MSLASESRTAAPPVSDAGDERALARARIREIRVPPIVAPIGSGVGPSVPERIDAAADVPQPGDPTLKSPVLYRWILAVWGVLLITSLPVTVDVVSDSIRTGQGPIAVLLLLMNAVFIRYFWLNGVKDLVYVLYFYLRRSALLAGQNPARRAPDRTEARVLLLYCTANDFSAESLARCLPQTHPSCELVILDDSTDAAAMAQVDAFAARSRCSVVRRPDRRGFKAGNLNHYLAGRTDYDYFVILDSDEIIPADFVDRALDYFAASSDVGIVQATHRATRNRTPFMHLFARGVNSHWPTYQIVKHAAGFMSLLGHGAMVSRRCYEAVGGFPHVVAEDLCFSIEARQVGFFTHFANDIVCEEEYPVDYLAFKKRHSKWTQGNLEFIRAYSRRILTSRLSWFEKLDIVLFTYNLPLTAIFAIYLVLNLVVFPLAGLRLEYPLWMIVPTGVFLFAPMLNDVVFHWRSVRRATLVWYLLNTFLLYGSMFFVSLYASLRGMLGAKAVFIVTPKESERVRLGDALRHNWRELAFGCALIATALVLDRSILPVVMIVVPSFLSVYLTLLTSKGAGPRGRHSAAHPLFVSWDELVGEVGLRL